MKMDRSKIVLIFAVLLLLASFSVEATISHPLKIAIVKLKCSTEPNLQAFQSYLNDSPYIDVVQLDNKNYINHTSLTEGEIKSWKTTADILVLVKMTERQIEIRAYHPDTAKLVIGKRCEGAIGAGEPVFKRFSQNLLDFAKVFEPSREIQSVGKEPIAKTKAVVNNELSDIPKDISAAITDSALIKAMLLDYYFNIVGINWRERRSFGIGETVLINNLNSLFKKYDITDRDVLKGEHLNVMTRTLEGLRWGGEWHGGENYAVANIYLKDYWNELLDLKNWGCLPKTKFKDGKIILSIKHASVSISFGENTECQLNGTTYIYLENKWYKLAGQLQRYINSSRRKKAAKNRVENELYNMSLSLYKEGKYNNALKKLKKFIEKYPNSDLADNAYFWIGNCYMFMRKYEHAILAYQKVIEKYPYGDKVSSSMLKQAVAFSEIGDKVTARLLLKEIIEKYHDSDEAKTANLMLQKIK